FHITKKGAAHPQYRPEARKAYAYNATQRMSPRTIKILLLLHALGRARTVELTLLAKFRTSAGVRASTGWIVERLKKAGHIQGFPGGNVAHPPYRLTKSGRRIIASLVGVAFPPSDKIRHRLRRELALFSEEYAARSRSRAFKRGTAERPVGSLREGA